MTTTDDHDHSKKTAFLQPRAIKIKGSKCVQPYERIPFHLFLGRVQQEQFDLLNRTFSELVCKEDTYQMEKAMVDL
ncbi:hypothetical protein H5410_029365 [Solanum commersonii]|uniref:Uncharacterized protein n=1 Tax=Solanum commersonii TaxID=4109 RepID=A0A9J5Z4S6_SOLCO|nr:hypothetical protein H5410_029365 [Solanum commersonii]